MISLFGGTFLIISFLMKILIIFLFIIKKIFFSNKLINLFVYACFISILLSFFSLMISYIFSDFSNYNVFQNSSTSKPLLYKIIATWSNHEGSMLLWLLIMSSSTLVFSFNKSLDNNLKNTTIFFQSLLFLAFCSFVIFTSNPFLINPLNVKEGLGLNPILQDPALAIHPPILYLGYVGFSIILSFALGGLITDKIDIIWCKVAKRWSLFCWSMLTAGIALGSYWAYYELGWGGWWFWDPVENVSLMPWIAGLALVHSLIIFNKEQMLKQWIIFLSILCFSLSIIGTFLVRSGILTSVHAFASDASRGIFIIILFLIITGFSLILFIIKDKKKYGNLQLLLLNKTTVLVINNIIMIIACLTILLGTIYPIIVEVLTNKRISVGHPYYNSTVIPILLPGLLLMSVGPALSWQSNKLNHSKFYVYAFIAISIIAFIIMMATNYNTWGFIGIFIGLWVTIGSLYFFFKNLYSLKNKRIIRSFIINSGSIAHFGVGLLIIGITCSTVFKSEYQFNVAIKEKVSFGDYELEFNNLKTSEESNFQSLKADFSLYKKNKLLSKIIPEKRYYLISKIITTEAGIYHHPFQDFYIVLGDQYGEKWSIKVYQNPLVGLIWLGALIMFCSGLVSILKK